MKLPLLLLTALLALTACRTQQTRAQQPSHTFLLFQKTPCLGICPSYEASFATDGSILYIGREHVPVKDTVYFELPAAELLELRQEVEKLDYMQLHDTYLTQWSDMPSTISTFYKEGKEVKRVKHQEGGPQALLEFQEKLHRRLMELVEEEARRRLPVK